MTTRPMPHLIEVEEVNGVVVVKFNEFEIVELPAVQLVGRQLESLVDAGARRILLNFASLTRLSSLLVGKVIALHRILRLHGGEVALCGIPDHLYKVFELLNLPRLMRVYKDEQEALERMTR